MHGRVLLMAARQQPRRVQGGDAGVGHRVRQVQQHRQGWEVWRKEAVQQLPGHWLPAEPRCQQLVSGVQLSLYTTCMLRSTA